IIFLGDSITHQCLYTQYLENFFLTRYPDRRIQFHNAGVSGDNVGNVLVRFEDDVAAYDPDYVLILLGMNDGQYEDFNAETFSTYQKGMGELLDYIQRLDAKPILLSPTMFDHATAERRVNDPDWRFRSKEFSPNYNALMAFFGGWGLEEAGRRRIPFVNLWAPLNTHTIAQRHAQPEFTMIDDAIHPQASGQFVMAFEILSQLGVREKSVSGITVTNRGTKWIGRGVENLSATKDGAEIRFSFTARSLPWVIPEDEATINLKWQLPSDGRMGYRITKAGHKLSADRLKVAGLKPGTYEVLIYGQAVGKWSHIALGTKIEIQENERTPQYQQALQVALLNQKRNDQYVRPLRDVWGRIKGYHRKIAAGETELVSKLDEAKAEAESLSALASNSLSKIYQVAQPKKQEWIIRKVESEN
ncbi:MAG: SGNH/GDSL hydrolase family protein, partial [Verrucomicrobiota bacterium]